MKKIFLGLLAAGIVIAGAVWIFNGTSQGRQSSEAEIAIDPEFDPNPVVNYSEKAIVLGDNNVGGRGPASETEVVRGIAEEEINTLTDDGITRDSLSGNKSFTNKYGEFFVEVVADKHDEDAPSVMKFYVKCKDNRKVKVGNPPARVLQTQANVSGLTTCSYDDVVFIEDEEKGDTVKVTYHIDVSKTKARKAGREYCDQVMNVKFNFPELCEKWNPDAFE